MTPEDFKIALKLRNINSKKMVMFFSPWLNDNCFFEGELIDKVLHCKEDEKGFVVSKKYRQQFLKEFPLIITEREPSLSAAELCGWNEQPKLRHEYRKEVMSPTFGGYLRS